MRAIPKYVSPIQKYPDREICRMSQVNTYIYTPGSTTGVSRDIGCTNALYITMNDIVTPGAWMGPWTGLNTLQGFNEMQTRYTNWQVRGCRVTMSINQITTAGSGTPQQVETAWMIVPLSAVQVLSFSATVATTAWDRMVTMPGRSRIKVTSQQQYGPATNAKIHLSCFSSPQRLEDPGYLNDSRSWGVLTSPPTTFTGAPCFALIGSHEQSWTATPGLSYTIVVKLEYSVLWFGRLITPLVTEGGKEEKKGGLSDESLNKMHETEEDFDDIPAFKSLSVAPVSEEKKEEKKEEGKEEKKETTKKGWFT